MTRDQNMFQKKFYLLYSFTNIKNSKKRLHEVLSLIGQAAAALIDIITDNN